MAVPKQKSSLHKRKLRRQHIKVVLRGHSICTNCKADKLPHHVCLKCGFYKDRKFLNIS